MNGKKLKTWRETFSLNSRALRMFYRHDPRMILSRIIHTVWTALTPYAGIYLMALLIDEISQNRDEARIKMLVWVILGAGAGIGLVTAFLNKWKMTQEAGLWYKVEMLYGEKLLDMDYGNLDNTENMDLLSKIRQNENGGGWGLRRVIENCDALVSSLLTLVGGVVMTIPLFYGTVFKETGSYGWLNHPLTALIIIILMLIITCGAPALSNKAGSYWALYADRHTMGNRLFVFLDFWDTKMRSLRMCAFTGRT